MSRTRIAIVGAGFAGIGTALRLQSAGEQSFVLIERADSVGGTWRDNRYPGVACDVPSHLYCYSFLPNPGFSRRFAPGEEIRTYLEKAAEPIREHIRFGTDLLGADWHGDHWLLQTSTGVVRADALVLACGRLTEPLFPTVDGEFEGPIFHSSCWDEDVELTGARVAVVGTGASAVQFVPHIAERAASLVVMQRSASYVLPRDDLAYTAGEQARFAAQPSELLALRAHIHAEAEALFDARVGEPLARATERERALAHVRRQIDDDRLRSRVTPDHEFGCKRVLFSNDYYPALAQPHVTVTGALTGFTDHDVIDADGDRHDVDVVILATGFHSTRQPYAKLVRGRAGMTLDERWAGGMQAYASTCVHGFPNLFVLDGPHASLSHNSAILMIEAQIDHVLGALEHLPPGATLEARADAEDEYAAEIARRSATLAWTSGCSNTYVDPRNGRQVLLWPGLADEFRDRIAGFDPAAYHLSRRPAAVTT